MVDGNFYNGPPLCFRVHLIVHLFLLFVILISFAQMRKSVFHIKKMDCPSEENLIRMKLDDYSGIIRMDFRIEDRKLTIYHDEDESLLLNSLESLSLDSSLVSTTETEEKIQSEASIQSKLLWQVLIINFSFFILEMTFGLISNSMGLVADSLDMLSDSFVYSLSLLAVGTTVVRKKRIAKFSGYVQILLAVIGITEVARRYFFAEDLPDFILMIVVSSFALAANWVCLYILQRSKSSEAHMKASMIFTSNDIIINAGVITAGVLVSLIGSRLPDLIIGLIVFAIVLRGAIRILKLAK